MFARLTNLFKKKQAPSRLDDSETFGVMLEVDQPVHQDLPPDNGLKHLENSHLEKFNSNQDSSIPPISVEDEDSDNRPNYPKSELKTAVQNGPMATPKPAKVDGSLLKPKAILDNYNAPCHFLLQSTEIPIPEVSMFQTPIYWGLTDSGYLLRDLSQIRSLILFGAPATGKTTFVYQTIASILLTKRPEEIRFILADPKGLQFNFLEKLDNYFIARLGKNKPIIEDSSQLLTTLSALVDEISNRFELLKVAGVRSFTEFNKQQARKDSNELITVGKLPELVLIIDDLESFCLTYKIEITGLLTRICLDGYKVGVTTVITSNDLSLKSASWALVQHIEHRVSFRMIFNSDFKKIFDGLVPKDHLDNGAFFYNDGRLILKSRTLRQDFNYINEIVNIVAEQQTLLEPYYLPEKQNLHNISGYNHDYRDPLFEDAARLLMQTQIGSTSLIQRRMKLGINRACRIMDQLEVYGIVGPSQGSKPREVLVKTEAELSNLF